MSSIESLREYPLFSGLTDEELTFLSSRLIKRSFAKGSYLFFPGSPGQNAYFLESGLARLFFCNVRGEEFLLNLAKPHAVIGLPTMAEKNTRLLGASVQASSILQILPGEDMLHLMRSSLQFSMNVYEELASTSRKLLAHYQAMVIFGLDGRLAALLLHLSGQGTSFELPISQADLASWLGVSRGRLNRAMLQFQQRDWIRMEKQTLSILNQRELHRLAEGISFEDM